MATPNQIRANRANAQRSTGPRAAEGKAASALNALKHGLCAQSTVLPGENIDDFHALVAGLEDEFQPATALECMLLRQLADAEWRMRRIPHIEAGMLAKKLHDSREHFRSHRHVLPRDPALAEMFILGASFLSDARGADALSKLSRYEARLSHRYFKALKHLREAQGRRRSAPAPAAGPAREETQSGQTNPISSPAPSEDGTAKCPQPCGLEGVEREMACPESQTDPPGRGVQRPLDATNRTRPGGARRRPVERPPAPSSPSLRSFG